MRQSSRTRRRREVRQLDMGKLSWVKRACAVFALCAATAIALPAQTFTTLHSFDSTDGWGPNAGLVRGTDGNLYGTTYGGGVNDAGTVFKITPSGTLTTLYSFCSQSGCTDGEQTYAGLVQGTDGNFYGVTYRGGTKGYGTVFKITPSGTLTTLYNFCSQSNCVDGDYPLATLIQATDGNFYGTAGGGANGWGTVFKITPGGTLTTLYSFCAHVACSDGSQLFGGLVQANDGNFYGTTQAGGANGDGTVFKITPTGTLTTLYSFCSKSGCTDGLDPDATLVQATNGNLYGATFGGGANEECFGGCGTLFKITPSGTFTTFYSFCSERGCADGEFPDAALLQGTDGNFYGTIQAGGANGYGTVFKITPSGALTTLYTFCSQGGCMDGRTPYAALLQDTDGNFYGTTGYGGADDDGTVFSLSVGLGPFVETQPAIGKAGRVVKILGTNLTGATSVTFNGTPATFTVVSSSLITATVPVGATSGKVQVVTPGGTLSSNVPFRVRP